MDNTVLTYNGIELYQSEIDILCDEYINTLHDPNMIYKSTVFSGLLNYIYKNKLRYIIPNTYNNDYNLLNDIFYNVYIDLCTKYNIVPSIIQFVALCHIDRTSLTEIKSGIYRDGSRVKQSTSDTVQKWFDTCESMLLSKASNESSIGSIFALKANYQYRDNEPIQVLQVTAENKASPEQIAERYKDIEKPNMIELSDN